MTLVVCAGVLAISVYTSRLLARFIRRCDQRQEYIVIDLRKASVIAAAEQITREAAES